MGDGLTHPEEDISVGRHTDSASDAAHANEILPFVRWRKPAHQQRFKSHLVNHAQFVQGSGERWDHWAPAGDGLRLNVKRPESRNSRRNFGGAQVCQ
jgi:hypothetical protein